MTGTAVQNLIFDADDTLWENNVLFERAIEIFIDHVDHPELSHVQVRERLDEIEKINTHRHGYGVDSFQRSLAECLDALRPEAPVSSRDQALLETICAPIRAQAVELIDGVRETLNLLFGRHRLFLLTKGNIAEQSRKIIESGLAEVFHDAAIVPEKDPGTYKIFAEQRNLNPDETWMIGNSPRSDIWPALEAGWNAVHVPHPMTWSLEVRELPEEHDRLRTVTPFSALKHHF